MPRRNDISKVLVIAALLCGRAAPCTIEVKKPVNVSHACGVLLSDNGAPLAGIALSVQPRKTSSGDAQGKEAVTDAQGRFDFGDLPQREYLLNSQDARWGASSSFKVK